MTFQSMASASNVGANRTNPVGFSVDVEFAWRKTNTSCNKNDGNPFNLDDTVLERTKEVALPLHLTPVWKKVIPDGVFEYHGRFLIHDDYVRYDGKEQPREKSNEQDQVNELINDFEVYGYREDATPPIAIKDPENLSPTHIKGLSGFHRRTARNRLPIQQKLYFYDLYSFSSLKWERVARNVTNHHGNPQLKQKWTDYRSETINAVRDNIIPDTEDAITNFVELIAADKPASTRKKIRNHAFKSCNVYPNFRTYGTSGNGVGTIQDFVSNELGLPKMGFEGRTDNDAEEIKKQGYILYASDRGDGLRAWSSGTNKAMRWGIPTWVFGYSSKRVDDLIEWRENFIDEFLGFKETQIQFAHCTARAWVDDDCRDEYDSFDVEDLIDSIDEESFPIKLGGFLPQHTSRNANDGGRPTESGLVDVYGKSIVFNPKGDCLTLTQP